MVPGTGPAGAVAAPPAKRTRLVGKAPHEHCKKAEGGIAPDVASADHGPQASGGGLLAPARRSAPVVVEVPASLDGLEMRLRKLGEIPRFKLTEGSYLEHRCTSMNAVVKYWPSTLLWCTEGPDSDAADGALAAPLPLEEESVPT